MANTLKISQLGSQIKVVHQLLHGYSDGHRLLESSFKLQDDLARLILRMSDLSGSTLVSGFEDYITGYPLASINAYALAKTWYASEMPRPGCVWTHSLVIPAQTMSGIPSLISLVRLFKRPSGDSFHGQYSEDLVLDEVFAEIGAPLERTREVTKGVLDQLLWSYYGMGRPVVLAAKTSEEFEGMAFALWSQQWPNLRLGFTFCTGSLSARSFAGRPFDIQCVPTILARDILRETIGGASAEPILIPSSEVIQPESMSSADVDALSPSGGSFRQFLWAVADDSASRVDFISFMKVFDSLKGSPELSTLINSVAQLFPQPSAGSRLKYSLFGNARSDFVLPNYEEQDVLLALATTSDYQSFDAEALLVGDRVAKLSVEKPGCARWLVGQLFRSTLNPLGEEILAGLISAMDPGTAREVAREQPQFLPALFRAKPSLASSPQLWLAGADRKRELFESVAAHERLDSALVAGVVKALLETGSELFISRALNRWGKGAVYQVLDWTEVHDGKLSETCREALSSHLSFVMDWVQEKPTRSFESLVAVAHVVAPYSNKILQYDSTVWLRTFRYLQENRKEGEAAYISAFLLALAFGNAPPSALDLVSLSFERVHEDARREVLSDNAWIILEPFVPVLSWRKNWDKCERLRRGLISSFVRHRWPALELRKRIQDDKLLGQLLKSASKVEGGEAYFQGIA